MQRRTRSHFAETLLRGLGIHTVSKICVNLDATGCSVLVKAEVAEALPGLPAAADAAAEPLLPDLHIQVVINPVEPRMNPEFSDNPVKFSLM